MKKTVAIYLRAVGTEPELLSDLRQIVEDRGDVVLGTFVDNGLIEGKGKLKAWNRLLADLNHIDQIVLNDVGDLPGLGVKDFLAILTKVAVHNVAIFVPSLDIDTRDGTAAVVALTAAYQRAKLSQAIRRGQERARKAGRRIGRPPIPAIIRRRIMADLAAGGGVRPTARKYGVSPASVVSISHNLIADSDRLVA
jgi:DNA invertase Pin-like site-specific DNA recombinase